MKGSKCGSELVSGQVHFEGGALSFFLGGGLFMANLSFKAPQWREHVIQETSDVLPAHYCDNCGAVVIETKHPKISTLEP